MTPLLLANVTLAVLLIVSAVAKLRSGPATRDAFVALRLPRRLADSPAPAVLPWAEIALGVVLIVGSGWVLVVACVAAVALFVAYTVIVARALGFDEPVNCSCFGALGAGRITATTVVRNIILVVLAVLGLVGAAMGASIYDWAGTDWLWVAVAALAAAGVALSLGAAAEQGQTSAPGSWTSRASVVDDAGVAHPLRSLVADSEGAVALFVMPGCASCSRAVERLAGAGDGRRRVIVLKPSGRPSEPAWTAIGSVFEDVGYNIGHALGVTATPAAVVLDAQGRQVGTVAVGEDPVVRLVTGSAPEPSSVPDTSRPAPVESAAAAVPEPAPSVEEDDGLDYVRTPIPDGVLLRQDGEPVTTRELAAQRAQLLVGINCLCMESRRALETSGLWQQKLGALDVAVVAPFRLSPGSVPDDQAERALYDHRGLTSSTLGLEGQASAVLLGADGLLAGGPVFGFDEIDQFVGDIAEQLGQS